MRTSNLTAKDKGQIIDNPYKMKGYLETRRDKLTKDLLVATSFESVRFIQGSIVEISAILKLYKHMST